MKVIRYKAAGPVFAHPGKVSVDTLKKTDVQQEDGRFVTKNMLGFYS